MVQTALLAALQFAPSLLTDFYARKVCHSVSGLLMMQLDPRDGLARWYVYAVVVVSLRSPNRPNSFFAPLANSTVLVPAASRGSTP